MGVTTYAVKPQVFKALTAASISATTAASATAIGTVTNPVYTVAFASTLNQMCMLTVNNVDFMAMAPSATMTLSLGPEGYLNPNSAGNLVFGLYTLGATPASGFAVVSCY